MKNSFLVAAALASTMVVADSGLEKMFTQGLMNYVGLTPGSVADADKVIMADEADTPKVKTYGYETASYSSNALVGYEIGLNGDLGWNYELPLYNQD